MPPKDSAAKKKSRAEMRKEIQLALRQRLQQLQQPSQHADGPLGSQQESPVLPLALPTPSTHSTTGSTGTTGPAPPIRSIRCSFATTHLPTESGTAGASLRNKRRGVVVRDPEFQKRSEQMKKIRVSSNKKSHSGGAKPFVFRAKEYKKKGKQAPHSKTYRAEGTSKVQQASDEAVASLIASMPSIEDTSDNSVTAPSLPKLPVDVEIGVMERMASPSRGTKVLGLGSDVAKQPRKRGPSQPTEPRTEAVEEELARLRANQKNLEERLQQQEREREMERQERERERLAWEARIQAQFKEMARQMRMAAPPFDGSNSAP